MKKRLYIIDGIPKCFMQLGEKEFREDLKFFEKDNDKIVARVSLTPLEALSVRLQMVKYNLRHPYVLTLTKLGGKRYRV